VGACRVCEESANLARNDYCLFARDYATYDGSGGGCGGGGGGGDGGGGGGGGGGNVLTTTCPRNGTHAVSIQHRNEI